MLEIKYLYDVTYLVKGPTRIKASKYIGNPVYFKCDYYRNFLFELLYDNNHMIERSKIFKVVRK